jgi:hypothetical protein
MAGAATARAIRYAQERTQGGAPDRTAVPIVEHPDVRRMLLRMKAQSLAARALVYYAFGQLDRARAGDGDAAKRLDLLTPLAKAHATDLGCEVTSLGIQVHGGMGYIEETGVAQFFRDARIPPIYEGTNGIQAADLVGRKLGQDNGGVVARLVEEMRGEAQGEALVELVDACDTVARRLLAAESDDRLAASYPFLTMLSVAVCGWLMERQARAAGDDVFGTAKRAVAAFYGEQIVPEALGLEAAATAGAAGLYALSAEELAG